MRHDSTGRRMLRKLLQHHTATAVGRVCRVSRPAVTQWALGTKRPSERAREILETRYKIPPEAWYQKPREDQLQGLHIGVVPEQE